jgi:hypothetical protein
MGLETIPSLPVGNFSTITLAKKKKIAACRLSGPQFNS